MFRTSDSVTDDKDWNRIWTIYPIYFLDLEIFTYKETWLLFLMLGSILFIDALYVIIFIIFTMKMIFHYKP